MLKGNVVWQTSHMAVHVVDNLPLHISTRAGFVKLHEEVGAPMAKHIETKL